jgi:small subunit ribosomal protein S20
VAHSISAKKRMRQNAKRRAQNRGSKRVIKEDIRAFEAAVAGGDKTKAAELLNAAVKRIGKTATKSAIHKNTASRKISRLQRKFNAMAAKA